MRKCLSISVFSKSKGLLILMIGLLCLAANVHAQSGTFIHLVLKGVESVVDFNSTNELVRYLKEKEYQIDNGEIDIKEIGLLKNQDAFLSLISPKQAISSIVTHIGVVGSNWLKTNIRIHQNLGRSPRPKTFQYRLRGLIEHKPVDVDVSLQLDENSAHVFESNRLIWFKVRFKLAKHYPFLLQDAFVKFKLGESAIKIKLDRKFNYSGTEGKWIDSGWHAIRRKDILADNLSQVHSSGFVKPALSLLVYYKQPNWLARTFNPHSAPVALYSDENLFRAEELAARDDGHEKTVTEKQPPSTLGFEWVKVSAGSFKMGSNEYSDEKPVHRVYLDTYYISKYEVTFDQYDAFCAATGRGKPSDSGWGRGSRPVINVSWYDAVAFCEWLSRKTGRAVRLPTEAEWEKAARGGNNSRGYEYSGGNVVGSVAWYSENSGSKTHPVGRKSANELGIYDMSGNVWEWCSDWYDKNYYSRSSSRNPTGPSSGSYRVFRGGGWGVSAGGCRSANRNFLHPSNRFYGLGFRPVMEP